MASLVRHRTSQTFHIRYRGRSFRRSLGTACPKLARAIAGRVEETLLFLGSGRLQIPTGCDPAQYILTDGKRVDEEPPLITVGELVAEYQASRVPGDKEPSTITTEDLHLRHLQRIIKLRTFAQALSTRQLQQYVRTRLSEVRKGSRPVAAETVRKEVATFRIVWNWAARMGILQGPAPVAGLVYPKQDQKLPFMTWTEIERAVSRNGMSPRDAKLLWESLYLTRDEVHQVLEHIRRHAKHEFIYPLVLFVAHAGVRLSEAVRSQIEDIDLDAGTVLVREKKRSRVRAMTFRRVDLTPPLHAAFVNWLANHPGGRYTFCKIKNLSKSAPPSVLIFSDLFDQNLCRSPSA